MRYPGVAAMLLAGSALFGGCSTPPPEAYVTATRAGNVDVGRNAVGEACVQGAASGNAADIYCGAWQQPSAHVRLATTAPGQLAEAIGTGPWRATLNRRYECGTPRPVTLGGMQALQMDCTGRVGGWPYVGVAAMSGGKVWLADGVVSALPAVAESIAVLSGAAPVRPVRDATVVAQQAARAGQEARNTGDSRQYDYLMQQGTNANLLDDPVAAESAYSAALQLQEKVLGKDNPNLAVPLMLLGLQLSNQGRFAEADAQFARAATLAPRQTSDATIMARLRYYEGLHAYNQGKPAAALAALQEAEAGYLAKIDPTVLAARPVAEPNSFAADVQNAAALPLDDQTQLALTGLIETKRFEAVVLRDQNRLAEAEAKIEEANRLARNTRLVKPRLTARLRRSAALGALAAGREDEALARFVDSTNDFRRAYPGSRPLALVGLLNAAELLKLNRAAEAAAVCEASVAVLVEAKAGSPPGRMAPCLDAFASRANALTGTARQDVLAQMFVAAQLVRDSKTEQQISQAAARLGAGGANPAVGNAIRQQQDAALALATVRRKRQDVAEAAKAGDPVTSDTARLAEQERQAEQALAEAGQTLQAAAPNYGQLVQQVTRPVEILNLLAPGEAFASITLTPGGGWVFLLKDGRIEVEPVIGDSASVDRLVARIRAGMVPATPQFDTKASEELFAALFGRLKPSLVGVSRFTVAPAGSLLSLPFGLLLTTPADPARLEAAPWLARDMAIGHVPAPSNFVALRRAGTSHARNPWFGFGDFRPVTLAQARRSFGPACGDSAQQLAQLPPLPAARKELAIAARLLGAGPNDELVGPDFTVGAIGNVPLADYRILHFASHAILPSDLKCQIEPAIVTSPKRDASDAKSALLTASDVTQLKLDADLVILSACNTGGSENGTGGGESLSSLARSFFYGGARGLLVTHWDVDDQVATFIISDTLRLLKDGAADPAGALHQAQVDLLDRAGKSVPQALAHPYYWAPFALIGPSGSAAKPTRLSMAPPT